MQENQAEKLESVYENSEVVNDNREECLKENHMAALSLTGEEATELSKKRNVEFVEEDVEVSACTGEGEDVAEPDDKKVQETVQEEGDEEWNLRMIHADQARDRVRKKKDKDPVKIAILDSGVDYNTDMNIN